MITLSSVANRAGRSPSLGSKIPVIPMIATVPDASRENSSAEAGAANKAAKSNTARRKQQPRMYRRHRNSRMVASKGDGEYLPRSNTRGCDGEESSPLTWRSVRRSIEGLRCIRKLLHQPRGLKHKTLENKEIFDLFRKSSGLRRAEQSLRWVSRSGGRR